MSLISGFIHYNVLRYMCDPKDNEVNNKELEKNEEKKPDIEMGIKNNDDDKNKNKKVQKQETANPCAANWYSPDYWWV